MACRFARQPQAHSLRRNKLTYLDLVLVTCWRLITDIRVAWLVCRQINTLKYAVTRGTNASAYENLLAELPGKYAVHDCFARVTKL